MIAQGIVPRLLQLVGDNMMPMQIKVEATVTLGSLAKGTEDNVKALVDLSIVPVLINGECDVVQWQIKVCSLFYLLQAFHPAAVVGETVAERFSKFKCSGVCTALCSE